MDKASDRDLKRLHEAADQVYAKIAKKVDPTEAVIKVARGLGLTRNWTQRLSEITNRLLTVDHIENSDGEEKASAHRLVDIDGVMNDLFSTEIPGARKAAARGPLSPRMTYRTQDAVPTEKAASRAVAESEEACQAPMNGSNPQDTLQRASMMRYTLKGAKRAFRDVQSASEQRVADAVKAAAAAIMDHDVIPTEIEERGLARFGNDVRPVMAQIEKFAGQKFTRFEGRPRAFTTDPWNKSPFREVKEALITTRQEAVKVNTAQKIASIAERGAAAIDMAVSEVIAADRPAKKSAAGGGGLASGTMIDWGVPDKIRERLSKGTTDRDILLAGVTPEDVSFLNSVRARDALVSALQDPVIQRADLSDVLSAYNRIGNASPRGVMNEAVLTTLLRSALEREQEPFDIEQTDRIEKGLASQENILEPSRA